MKRFLLILTLVYGLLPLAHSQDAQRLFEQATMGTARYVGMGGAMTAIGGDPSAVLVNPAGLGIYRSSELTLTLDETIDLTSQSSSSANVLRGRFATPNVAAVWAWGNPDKQRGLIFNNFMISINRLANYHRDVHVKDANLGMVETMCVLTGGRSESSLLNRPWDDSNIGWLSILGFENYLIDPADDGQWIPAVDFTEGELRVSESGQYDQYTISWASNISNQWYVGLGLNIPTITYTKNVTLSETNRLQNAQLQSMYHLTAVGVSVSMGCIYRPVQALRLGLALQAPTIINISAQTEGSLSSYLGEGKNYQESTPNYGYTTKLTSPLRTSASVAGQLGKIALLALQYDYAHSGEMCDVHTLRAGLEAQVYKSYFLNAGYVYESSFLKEDPVWALALNDIRTDTDYRYTDYSQSVSAGFGYRSDNMVAHLSYQYAWQNLHQYASEMQLLPTNMRAQTHRIVATISWRF